MSRQWPYTSHPVGGKAGLDPGVGGWRIVQWTMEVCSVGALVLVLLELPFRSTLDKR